MPEVNSMLDTSYFFELFFSLLSFSIVDHCFFDFTKTQLFQENIQQQFGARQQSLSEQAWAVWLSENHFISLLDSAFNDVGT